MELNEFVKEVSLEDFGLAFKHKASWNKRLRSTGGRFFPKTGHLDFNPNLYKTYGIHVFRKIVRHELCHYHLYFAGRGYGHGDQDFKRLLKQVDGLRFTPRLPQKMVYQHYSCLTCGSSILRKKKINTQKFACGKCLGRLRFEKLIEISSEEEAVEIKKEGAG